MVCILLGVSEWKVWFICLVENDWIVVTDFFSIGLSCWFGSKERRLVKTLLITTAPVIIFFWDPSRGLFRVSSEWFHDGGQFLIVWVNYLARLIVDRVLLWVPTERALVALDGKPGEVLLRGDVILLIFSWDSAFVVDVVFQEYPLSLVLHLLDKREVALVRTHRVALSKRGGVHDIVSGPWVAQNRSILLFPTLIFCDCHLIHMTHFEHFLLVKRPIHSIGVVLVCSLSRTLFQPQRCELLVAWGVTFVHDFMPQLAQGWSLSFEGTRVFGVEWLPACIFGCWTQLVGSVVISLFEARIVATEAWMGQELGVTTLFKWRGGVLMVRIHSWIFLGWVGLMHIYFDY
jgi:hypothetical protein